MAWRGLFIMDSTPFFGHIRNDANGLRTSSLWKDVENSPGEIGEFVTCFDSRLDVLNPLASFRICPKNAVLLLFTALVRILWDSLLCLYRYAVGHVII